MNFPLRAKKRDEVIVEMDNEFVKFRHGSAVIGGIYFGMLQNKALRRKTVISYRLLTSLFIRQNTFRDADTSPLVPLS